MQEPFDRQSCGTNHDGNHVVTLHITLNCRFITCVCLNTSTSGYKFSEVSNCQCSCLGKKQFLKSMNFKPCFFIIMFFVPSKKNCI